MPRVNKARSNAAERALARRLEYERKAQDLTFERLAERMTDAGCPINGSGIYKIENAGRRITVEELVAFSRVFNIPVNRLLLPPELAAKKAALALWDEYETTRRKVVHLQQQMQNLESRLLDLVDTDQREAVLEALREEAGEDDLGANLAHMRLVRGYAEGGEQ